MCRGKELAHKYCTAQVSFFTLPPNCVCMCQYGPQLVMLRQIKLTIDRANTI